MPNRFADSTRAAALVSALLVLGAVISIGGCGHKGPLYLPDDIKSPPSTAPVSK